MVLGGGALLLHYHAGVAQAWLQQAQKRRAGIQWEQKDMLSSTEPDTTNTSTAALC